jgi:hypothetical protein
MRCMLPFSDSLFSIPAQQNLDVSTDERPQLQ